MWEELAVTEKGVSLAPFPRAEGLECREGAADRGTGDPSPPPYRHRRRGIGGGGKEPLARLKSSAGAKDWHLIKNHGVNRIPRRGIGMHQGRPPEKWKKELTSLLRMD